MALSGKMALSLGDLDEACVTAGRIEAASVDLDHPCAEVAVLTFQSQLAFFLGAHRDALVSATRAIAIADSTHDRGLRAAARRGTCTVLGTLEAPVLRAVLHERHALSDEHDLWDRGVIHNDLAAVAINDGDLALGRSELMTATELAARLDEPAVALRTILDATWAELHLALGAPDDALQSLHSAQGRLSASDCPNPYLCGMVTLLAIQVHTARGHLEQAEQDGRYGLTHMQQYLPGVRAVILGTLADVLRARGRVDEAYEALRASMDLEREMTRQFIELQHELTHAVSEAAAVRTEAESLREIAGRDWLTGLLNRRHLEGASFVGCGTVGLAAIDLDGFKSINDTFGHAAGDRVLARVAEVLQANAREGDPVVRLGGDEFVVVMPGVDAIVADICARRLLRALTTENWDAVVPGATVGASIGHAVGSDTDAVATILAVADRRLYRAKAAGRGRVVGNDLGE
jgi:diguanylate cyclase (GGDEF)-like protein